MLNSADERFAALPGFLRTRRFRNDDTVRSGVFVDEGSENASKDVGEVLQLVGKFQARGRRGLSLTLPR